MQKKQPQPPKYAQKFLTWLLKTELAEEVLGDLEEKFEEQLAKKSSFKAKANYYYQTFNYIRPFAMKNSIITDLNPFFMFSSYFKIAWRSFFKQKLYAVINVTGMTIGMSCFILIALYIQYELSYDKQHEKADRIYRIAQKQKGNVFRGSDEFAVSAVPLIPTMRADMPDVETGITLSPSNVMFLKDGQVIYERGIYADTALFDVFSYPVIEGDVRAALRDKDAIILTETMARKYFGYTSPLGQTMEQRDKRQVVVKAIIKDIPNNQHFGFDFVISLENYGEYRADKANWRWESNNYWSYVVLKEGADIQKVEAGMKPYGEKAAQGLAKYNLLFKPTFFLQPLTDIHLYSNINSEIGSNGDINYLYLSISIALIILVLALINYINLATARTSQRSKEVGVRKVLGAAKKQLINQFMLESALVTGISFILALVLANWSMPFFNELMGMEMVFSLVNNQQVFFSLAGIAIFLSICAGLYPAILSSTIGPIKALKGKWFKSKKGSGNLMRNTLVIGQFTIAIVLGIGSVIIFQQLQFMQTKKLGYKRDQVVFVPYQRQDILAKSEVLVNELQKHAAIEKATIVSDLPLNTRNQGIANQWEGKTANDEQLHIYRQRTDYNFFDVFEMDLIAGRNFSPDFPTDAKEAYILNESAVKKIGWDKPIGKSFRDGKVIGVVKDFHFQPMDFAIEPMFITLINEETAPNFGCIVMKIKTGDVVATKAYVQQTLKTILPEVAFNFNYLEDTYNNLYQREQRFGDAFNFFTLIALFIACIGLFGLVTHSVLLRTKEIGIRKVLGASVVNLVGIISKDFLKLVVLSTLIAVPVAYWGMNTWLQDFVYRIDINWWVFIVVGLVAILIAFVTIGTQSLKAALSNPVEAIKSE